MPNVCHRSHSLLQYTTYDSYIVMDTISTIQIALEYLNSIIKLNGRYDNVRPTYVYTLMYLYDDIGLFCSTWSRPCDKPVLGKPSNL